MALLGIIRRWYIRDHISIREIARRLDISRNTVRRYIRSEAIEPSYPNRQSSSSLDEFAPRLSAWLSSEAVKSRKQRRTLKQMFLDLRELGYEGSYDRVAAFGRQWKVGQMERVNSASKSTTQDEIDHAPLFPVAAQALQAFVNDVVSTDTVWMSWGNYDFKQLNRDAQRHGIALPLVMPHQNAKRLFAKSQRIGKEVGMVRACALAGISLEGQHHRGLDDAVNIAKLMPWVLGHAFLGNMSKASTTLT